MPEKTFLPYHYESEALELKLLAVFMDGEAVDLNECVDMDHHQVALNVKDTWVTAKFEVEATDPNDELDRLINPGESIDEALTLMVTVRGSRGRFRKGVNLQSAGDNRWFGEFEILRKRHRGAVSVQLTAFRAKAIEGATNLAQRAHERVAASADWRFYIDEKPIMPGGAIDGEWCSFKESSDPEVSSRKDCAWYLDLIDPDRPRLLLNEDIEHLKPALENVAKRGKKAHLREVVSHSILQPVLLSLSQFALERNRELGLEEMDGWQKGILLSLARQIRGASEEARIEEWLNSQIEGDGSATLADTSAAIQRFLGMPEKVSKLVDAMEGGNG